MRRVVVLSFIDIAARANTLPRLEVVMQTIGLVISIVVAMTFFAGLSAAALYMTLPASMLERAARHGRFSGLGTRQRTHGGTAGNAPANTLQALHARSV